MTCCGTHTNVIYRIDVRFERTKQNILCNKDILPTYARGYIAKKSEIKQLNAIKNGKVSC